MTPEFDDFRLFVESEKERYVKSIRKKAKKLTLREIILNTDLDEVSTYVAHERNEFRYGETISFRIYPIGIYLHPDELVVLTEEATRLKKFSGTHVKGFYNKISIQIQQKIEEYLSNLPF